tara:strand:- start:2575 stop:2841 length:267 start_codon:yes stop_codon:yes gene_type:complete
LKRKPKYKTGTLLKYKYGSYPQREQVMIVGTYVAMGQIATHEGLIVENEVRMYDLMYLGDGGRKESQTERWLDMLIRQSKMEIAATPD